MKHWCKREQCAGALGAAIRRRLVSADVCGAALCRQRPQPRARRPRQSREPESWMHGRTRSGPWPPRPPRSASSTLGPLCVASEGCQEPKLVSTLLTSSPACDSGLWSEQEACRLACMQSQLDAFDPVTGLLGKAGECTDQCSRGRAASLQQCTGAAPRPHSKRPDCLWSRVCAPAAGHWRGWNRMHRVGGGGGGGGACLQVALAHERHKHSEGRVAGHADRVTAAASGAGG